MHTLIEAVNIGTRMGIELSRNHPGKTIDELMRMVDDLQNQLKNLPTEQLMELAGGQT